MNQWLLACNRKLMTHSYLTASVLLLPRNTCHTPPPPVEERRGPQNRFSSHHPGDDATSGPGSPGLSRRQRCQFCPQPDHPGSSRGDKRPTDACWAADEDFTTAYQGTSRPIEISQMQPGMKWNNHLLSGELVDLWRGWSTDWQTKERKRSAGTSWISARRTIAC